VYELLEIASLW